MFPLLSTALLVMTQLLCAAAGQIIPPLLSHDILFQVSFWVGSTSLLEGVGSRRYQAT